MCCWVFNSETLTNSRYSVRKSQCFDSLQYIAIFYFMIWFVHGHSHFGQSRPCYTRPAVPPYRTIAIWSVDGEASGVGCWRAATVCSDSPRATLCTTALTLHLRLTVIHRESKKNWTIFHLSITFANVVRF